MRAASGDNGRLSTKKTGCSQFWIELKVHACSFQSNIC